MYISIYIIYDVLKSDWYEPPLIFVIAILNILICNCNFIYQQYQELSVLENIFSSRAV